MFPEQMKVTCRRSPLDTEHLPKLGDGGHVFHWHRGEVISEILCAITPFDDHGVNSVRCGTLHVVGTVAHHENVQGERLQLGDRMGHHVGLRRSHPVRARPGDHFEVVIEAEVLEDLLGSGFGLRRGDGKSNPGGAQIGQQRRDAVENAVHRPASGRVVGAVCGDRLVGAAAEPHRGEGDVHGWPDDAGRQVTVRNGCADLAEGVTEAGHDSIGRIRQRAVEVEDHQIGAHAVIVPDGLDVCGRARLLGRPSAHYCRHVGQPRDAARYHGDQAAAPGMLDFAVNVRTERPPAWLVERLAARLPDLGHYPCADDVACATKAVARRHGRGEAEVVLLAGGAEGFTLLPRLRPRLAALVAPSFTEPEAALVSAGVPVRHVVLDPPFALAGAAVPDDADLVVLGNPTNPTSVLHPRGEILALCRPGRVVVVDEAFADAIPGEPESLAAHAADGVVVLRSLTKTWALAGLRVGYALGPADVVARLTHQRPHWPLGTLQLEAIAACCAPDAVAAAAADAGRLAAMRTEMAAGFAAAGFEVVDGRAPYLLFNVADVDLVRKKLHAKGIAVRRCDTFVGLDGQYLRAAVRPEWPELLHAIVAVMQ